jgi:hypothetical protein
MTAIGIGFNPARLAKLVSARKSGSPTPPLTSAAGYAKVRFMRIKTILIATVAAALALSASAQTSDGDAMDLYQAELDHQCPASHLEYLSPGQLRDGLDDYISSLPPDTQDRMRKAESSQCAASGGGATCVNQADIALSVELSLTDTLVTTLCGDFSRCRGPSDCDSVR